MNAFGSGQGCICQPLNDLQAKMLDHGKKVPVVVEERMALHQTERADDHVGRFAHRNSSVSQRAIVTRCHARQARVKHGFDGEPPHVLLDADSVLIVAGTLQHFKQHQVANRDLIKLIVYDTAEMSYRYGLKTAKISNPNGAINDGHRRWS